MTLISVLSIPLGYLIGSFSPSYFLGKWLKGIDIREHGDGNAGGTNAYHVLGLKAAIAVIIIDVSKGLLAVGMASLLGTSPLFVHLAGAAAVAGHVFPFYLSFRGGKGIGTAIGIMAYYFYQMISHKWISLYLFLIFIAVLVVIHLIIRKKEVLGIIALPLLLILVLVSAPINLITVFTGIYIVYISFMNIILNVLKLWRRDTAAQP
jgi:glycerol-3-phosphate acyltransferase PlsY